MTRTTVDTLVIGAGQAGLATAHHLARTGADAMILDASAGPGGSWPRYYDSLTLFSPARFAELPGMWFPGDPERYPHRDEVVDYLTRYADHLDADIRYGHRVAALDVVDSGLLASGNGFDVQARRVIVASGSFDAPYTPPLAGLDSFGGRVLHAGDYRRPEEFTGTRVAVVGAGNSAIQIAAELAEVAEVTVYSRDPIRWQRQRILGRDLHWWLTRSGLDRGSIFTRWLPSTVPVLDDGRYRAALRRGAVARRPMFARIDGQDLVGANGSRHEVDAILLATGYRPHLPFLAGTPAVDTAGMPLHQGGVSTTVQGLGFVGLEQQRSFGSATLRGVGRDAHAVLRLTAGCVPQPAQRSATS